MDSQPNSIFPNLIQYLGHAVTRLIADDVTYDDEDDDDDDDNNNNDNNNNNNNNEKFG